jgi:hypothetical protein
MSWYVKAAGKPGPALNASIERQFGNVRAGCVNNEAEVAAIDASHALVKAAVACLGPEDVAVGIVASGSFVPRNGSVPERLQCDMKIATILNWVD